MPRRLTAAETAELLGEPVAAKRLSADETARVLADEPAPEPSRLDRLVGAIKSIPGKTLDAGGAALDYQRRIMFEPVETAKDLASDNGTGMAALRGFGQGASAGFLDELEGVRGAVSEARRPLLSREGAALEGLPAQPQSMTDAYRSARDQRRHDDSVAQQGSPYAYGGGQLAGAVAMPVAKAGVAGRLTQAAGYGGLYGLGGGSSDLTRGEYANAAQDTLEGGAIGLATAGALEGVAAIPRAGTALRRAAAEQEGANLTKLRNKDFMSERGGLGSDTRAALTRLETAKEILASPMATAEMKTQARGFLESELGRQTQQTAWENTLDAMPSQLGQMQERRAAMTAAGELLEPAAIESGVRENLAKSTITNDVLPRIDRLVGNKALSMVGQFGGAPVTTTKNLLRTPRFQERIGQGLQSATPAAVVGRATQPGGAQMLEDYMRPKDDEERQRDGAAWFAK